jgi:hypothetical protein
MAMAAPKLGSGTIRCWAFNVRFGSEADILARIKNVRFTPESGHAPGRQKCPLSAKSGHQHLKL